MNLRLIASCVCTITLFFGCSDNANNTSDTQPYDMSSEDVSKDTSGEDEPSDTSADESSDEDTSSPDASEDRSADSTDPTDSTPDALQDEEVDTPQETSDFDDAFDSNSLSQWSLRHQVEGGSAQYTLLDVNTTTPGALTIVPTRTPGWYADGDAPLIFKMVQGNFSVETYVSTQSVTDPTQPPGSNFNSAGLMARDPAGSSAPESHLMVNVGRQNNTVAQGIGSEFKTTRNGLSRLELQDGGRQGRLILCRVANTFYAFRKLEQDDDWVQIGNQARPDMPDSLQVGMVANGYTGPDLQATFDYIRLTVPTQASECTPDT